MRYHDSRGKQRTESSRTPDRRRAEALLRARLTDVQRGVDEPASMRNVTVEQLVLGVIKDYKANAKKSVDDIETRWKLHLRPFFGGSDISDPMSSWKCKASRVTSALITEYIQQRRDQGAATASVNRELALLRRGFRLRLQSTPPLVRTVPTIKLLRENNARKQFLAADQRERLAAECAKVGLWMRTLLQVALDVGWRSSELLGLRVKDFDKINGTLRLETSKNGEGREVAVSSLARQLLMQCVARKSATDCILTRENGKPALDFRRVWQNCCIAASVGKLISRCCGTECIPVGKQQHRCPTCERRLRRGRMRFVGLYVHSLRRTLARDAV